MTAVKKQRNANLDLLRIVSMLLIVFLHSIDHSGVLENAENCCTAMYFYVRYTYALCMVCVNIYIMLSGYFMLNSKFRLHKLVTLWMETVFYSFTLKLLFMLMGKDDFSLISLASCFFPIITGRYWFLTIYVGMYLVSPFLNILIHTMDKKQHSLLNICFFILMSVLISIHPTIAGMNSGGGWGLAWFVVMYVTAAWFKKYYTPNHNPIPWLLVFLTIPLLIAIAQLTAVKLQIGILHNIVSTWHRYDSAPVYIMTLCLFAGFLNIRIQNKKISSVICMIAPLTLGVYLIHAHANVSPWSWEVLALPDKMGLPVFPLIQVGSILGIFVICIGIDAIRKATVGKLETCNTLIQVCNRISVTISCFLDKLIART